MSGGLPPTPPIDGAPACPPPLVVEPPLPPPLVAGEPLAAVLVPAAALADPGSGGVPPAGQAGGAGQGGDSAGAPTAVGEAGMGSLLEGAVHGRAQFGREPVVGMLVVLDETTSTKTAADGSFTFATAP